jgi:hypothetical protein
MRLPLAALTAAVALLALLAPPAAAQQQADGVVEPDPASASQPQGDQARAKPDDPGGQGKGKGKKDKETKAKNWEAKQSGKYFVGTIEAGAPCATIEVELGMDAKLRGLPPKARPENYAKVGLLEVENGETAATVCWLNNAVADRPASFAYHYEVAVEDETDDGGIAPQ